MIKSIILCVIIVVIVVVVVVAVSGVGFIIATVINGVRDFYGCFVVI